MSTSDKPSDSGPERKPADRTAERVRERTMNLLADVTVHVQRLEDIARKLGLTSDLVDGVGDHLYEAVVAQLDLATKIVERSQAVADRVLDLGTEKFHSGGLVRIDGERGAKARHFFAIANGSTRTAHVDVKVESASLGTRVTHKVGKTDLPGGHETGVEIVIDTADLDETHVYSGTIHVTLDYKPDGARKLPDRDFELWLRTP